MSCAKVLEYEIFLQKLCKYLSVHVVMNAIVTHSAVYICRVFLCISLQKFHEVNTSLWATELQKGKVFLSAIKAITCILFVLL